MNANGLVPIYLRITIAGIRTDIYSKRFVDSAKWNNQSQKVIGYNENVRSINSGLKALEIKVYKAYGERADKNLLITSASLKLFVFDEGITPAPPEKTILGVFRTNNLEMKSLIGNGFAAGTFQRYETSYSHTAEFIKSKYNMDDLF